MSHAASNAFWDLHQGTMTGPQYVAAFEKAYNLLVSKPSVNEAVAHLFYRANDQVQRQIRQKNGDDIIDNWSLERMKAAIRATANPQHPAKPQHPPPRPQQVQPVAVPYYYPVVGTPQFTGTSGIIGTINPGWWP